VPRGHGAAAISRTKANPTFSENCVGERRRPCASGGWQGCQVPMFMTNDITDLRQREIDDHPVTSGSMDRSASSSLATAIAKAPRPTIGQALRTGRLPSANTTTPTECSTLQRT